MVSVLSGEVFAAGEGAAPDAAKPASGESWILPTAAEKTGYDFTGYVEDSSIVVIADNKPLKTPSPVLKKDDDIWLPLALVAPSLNVMLLKIDPEKYTVIRSDGLNLELKIGEKEALLNRESTILLDKPPAIYSNSLMLSLDSISKAFNIMHEYDRSTNTVRFTVSGEPETTFFEVVKPPEPIEVKAKEEQPMPTALWMPKDIKNEMLPPEYMPDIDLKADMALSYFQDKASQDRTREWEVKLNGKTYSFNIDGRYRMRDNRGMQKQRMVQDGEFLSVYSKDTRVNLMDSYLNIDRLRSQSLSFYGATIINTAGPFKSTAIYGETNMAFPGPSGAVNYAGRLYSIKQEYTDANNIFKVSGMGIWQYNTAVEKLQIGTAYPRESFVYVNDATLHLYKDLDIQYTHALSSYTPDDFVNKRLIDGDWRIGAYFNKELYSFSVAYESVGAQYASIGMPSTYQDYESWDFAMGYKFAPNWLVNMASRFNRSNVERNPRLPVNFGRNLSTGTTLLLPWDQTVNFTWIIDESLSRGGDVDSSGSRYNDYRVDYVKSWKTLTIQFSYDRNIQDAFQTAVGGSLTDTYSSTIFKYFPQFYGSYIKYYQDFRKTKSLNALTYSTTTLTSDVGFRYYILHYLSVNADCRVTTTQRENLSDTEVMTLMLGGEFRSSPVTVWTLDYTLSDFDFLSKDQNSKHYTIMVKGRHIQDIRSPEKWGSVRVHLYRDLNMNCAFDQGDTAIPNMRVYVKDGRSAKTDSLGFAQIDKVVPGERVVKVDLSQLPIDMMVEDLSAKQVTVKQFRTSKVDFPVVKAVFVSGRVYADVDKSGEYGKVIDKALPNVRVYIVELEKETLTFSDGTYEFDYIPPGSYTIGIDPSTVPFEYTLSSAEKISADLKEGARRKDIDFVFNTKPIVVEHFDGSASE